MERAARERTVTATATRRARSPPVYEYSHDGGNCAVTGGYVYRGTAIPALRGGYLFADYCGGTLRGARRRRTARSRSDRILAGARSPAITSFGQDADGELYVLSDGGDASTAIDPRLIAGSATGVLLLALVDDHAGDAAGDRVRRDRARERRRSTRVERARHAHRPALVVGAAARAATTVGASCQRKPGTSLESKPARAWNSVRVKPGRQHHAR